MSDKRSHAQHLSAGHHGHTSRTPSPLRRDSVPVGQSTNTARSLAQRSLAHDPQGLNGATPNFELPSDVMFSSAAVAPADEAAHFAVREEPSFDPRSRSVPPLSFDGGASLSERRQKTASRRLPPIETVQRAGSKRRNFFADSEKRPASPHITSATPTSAQHHLGRGPVHRVASPRDDEAVEGFTIDQTVLSRRDSAKSPPLMQTSLGRMATNTAHSLMDAMTGRNSPVVRHPAGTNKSDRDSVSDDEAGKGHGKKAAGRFTPSIFRSRNDGFDAYPAERGHAHFGSLQEHRHAGFVAEPEDLAEGFSGNVSWRASLSESRRATPAAYRPRPGTPRKRGSGGHRADPGDSGDVVLTASHSVHIGSPIVVPQARRGAIRLKPHRRRRSSRLAQPSLTLRQRCAVLCATLSTFLHLLANPGEAAHRLREWVTDTRIYWDEAFTDPTTGTRTWRPAWLQAYVPLLIWLGISLSSTAMVVTFHTEVFTGLDRLSTYLQQLGLRGRILLGSLIFITTFPPLPLYSTLIILCGFSFGLWQGFLISYIAALSGAIVVFLLSRSLLKDWMVGLLNQSGGLKKVVRAIEKQPKLLFLVRLAPYPYNLMNTLLASSQTLTLKTYTTCTALALPKLLVHTGLGTSIKDFAAYNGAREGAQSEDAASASHSAETVKHIAGFIGVGLCIGIFIYLLQVARKAVDELDDEDGDVVDDSDLYSEAGESDGLLSDDEIGEDGLYLHGGIAGSDNDGVGMDMRERYGPGSRGFRNGYAPIDSAEDRLRQQMRHSVVSFDHTAHSLDDQGSGSGGPSIDLADKIAEMEAHAEGMSYAGGSGTANSTLPAWLSEAESPARSEFFEHPNAASNAT